MKKKKLLFICGPLMGGGAERVLVDLLSMLDPSIYDIDLALIYKGGEFFKQVPKYIKIIELWPESSLHHYIAVKFSTKLHSNWLLSRRMNSKRLKKNYDCEIAFLEGWSTKLLSLRKTDAKKISWIHTDINKLQNSFSCYHNRREMEMAYGKFDKIIAVSEEARKGCNEILPDSGKKMSVIYNPVDIKKINLLGDEIATPYHALKKNVPSDPVIVVGMGRLSDEKNPFRFLETASLAKNNNLNVRFVWLGQGPLVNELNVKRKELGLEETVDFIGFKSNPYPYLKHADIFMLTSDVEAFSMVACEAMSVGTPVLSTKASGPKELIGDNEFGIITDFSSEELFKGLKKLMESPSLRVCLAEKAYRHIMEFSPEKMLEEFNKLVNENG